ncbi:MAG: hypothetical protein ACLTL2_00110 [Blautia sp.]|uniref:hypothetical protein n=1 Tax=Blautia sp. TaxID=1955243 RepID=UPI0039968393
MSGYCEADVWRMESELQGLKAELAETENPRRCENLRNAIKNLEYILAEARKALGMD